MQLDPITRAVLDAMQEGVLIIDAQERIVYGNRAYVAFLEKEAGGPIGPIEGYPLRLLRPGARLPEVLAQKRPILHTPRQESEDIYFVNMYPIFDGAEVVGGLSVVTFWKDAFDFRAELERYEKRSRQVLRRVNKANSAHYTFDSIVAVSPRSAACRELASRLAQTDVTVLLQSESGTGKELYAQAIHNASPRSAGVFVAINCANFNANMLESELFGYTEGAFTGAKRGGKIGLFEAAAGGTLFLDEISEMDVGLQSKLLRALQERRIRPVGGVEEVETDVRIIAACNADLPRYVEEGKFRTDLFYLRALQERRIRPVGGVEEVETDVRIIAACNADLPRYVEEGKFRTDLFYRLNTFPIHIPPLRERREDIPPLCRSLLDELSRKLKRRLELTPEALDRLLAHNWPGNVRELRNVLEFCAYLTPSGLITELSLPENLRTAPAAQPLTLAQRTRAFEKQEILRLLACNGSHLEGKKKTAAQLGISLASLYNKLNGSF